MKKFDVAILGGGPAGMSAALAAEKEGAKVVLIERDECLGGILKQCIHNGFGLHYFHEELTGPEFAHRFKTEVEKCKNITVLTSTLVTKIEEKKVCVLGHNGEEEIAAEAVVLAMGCRERTAGNISLCGTRPSGVVTAGAAQKMVNIDGQMIGKNVVILGSGDIGLIMARRLTLEGAKVHAVLEINSTSGGSQRNILQCLEDFEIPLLYNTTIFEVVGKNRVEGVYYGQVNKNFEPIESTKKFIPCDTIILSVGLVPEMEIAPFVEKSPVTKGAIVNEHYQTSAPWLFSCGNILHVHDLVDNVALEASQAGKFAAQFAKENLSNEAKTLKIVPCAQISYVVPSSIFEGAGSVDLKFRLKEKIVRKTIVIKSGANILAKKFVLAAVPGEMMTMTFEKNGATEEISVEIQ